MSGITGIFRRDGRDVDPADIKKMNDKISHRGPDGSRVLCEGPVAFGHQMLHTTQESLHEILPFEDEESGLVITADARIDNRKDLAPLLGIEDNEYVSDSYFILKAYKKWGEKCPEELLGDFAFAIWDKNKEYLFCARDHMGVKPFYYYLSDNFFIFATEIKALFYHNIPKKLNEVMIADYVLYNFNDKKITFYKDIFRLPNAQRILITINKYKVFPYWKLKSIKEIKLDSTQEYVAKFRDIFFEAVNCRLRCQSQVGALLSGGLDSSSIVCTSDELLRTSSMRIKTFSAVFDEVSQCDERLYINEVLSKTKFDSYFVHGDQISPLYKYKDFFWHFDQPFFAPNLFIHWSLFEKAHDNGVRVILDGFDGDTTLSRSNYRYLPDLVINLSWWQLTQELKELSKKSDRSILNLFIQYIVWPLTPFFLRNLFIRLLNIEQQRVNKFKIFNRKFIKDFTINDRYNQLYVNNLQKVNNSREYHHLQLTSGSLQFLLELVDSMGGALEIEARFPFFDLRLVEYSFALPPEQKYFLGWDRVIMRKSMENVLPSKIQWRPNKSGLSPNFNRALVFFERDRFLDLIDNTKMINNYVDVDYLENLVRNTIDTNQNHLSVITIWKALTLYLWFKENKMTQNK